MTTNCLTDADLNVLLNEAADPSACETAAQHLGDCADCRRNYEKLNAANITRRLCFNAREMIPDLPASGLSYLTVLKVPSAASAHRSLVISGYEIHEEIGLGGTAVVYRATQSGLARTVAIKVLHRGPKLQPDRVARFRTEAEAVAKLKHPNIIQIHEVGESDDWPYLSLEWMDGGSLAKRLMLCTYTAEEAASLVAVLARAMQHAHDRGVIHRDLKPGNILFTADSVPKIADFGLAKSLDDDESEGLTRTGDVLGTPGYMAPEQITAGPVVGRAADIYALGAILFELLAGDAPFAGPDVLASLNRVVNEPPPRLPWTVPKDLATITYKCLEKEPDLRYRTAQALAEDLERFSEGRRIQAKPENEWRALKKWARRRPAVAALTAGLLFVTIAGLVGVTVAWLQARQAKQNETEARKRAEDDRERAEINSYFSLISQAHSRWLLNDTAGAVKCLEQCPPARRGWEWDYLQRLSSRGEAVISAGVFVNALAATQDLLFVAGGNPFDENTGGFLQCYDRGNRLVWENEEFSDPVWAVSHNPDTGVIAAASGSWRMPGTGAVTLHDAKTGQLLHRLTGPEYGSCRGVAISPDGTVIAVPLMNGNVSLLNIKDLSVGATLRHESLVTSLAFTADGRRLLCGVNHNVCIWDLSTNTIAGTCSGHGSGFALSADNRLATCTERGVHLWDLSNPDAVLPVSQIAHHDGPVSAVAWLDDGRLVSGSTDSTVKIWEPSTGRLLDTLRGHRGRVAAIHPLPGAREIVTAGRQPGEIHRWDVSQPQEYRTVLNTSVALLDAHALQFDAESKLFVLAQNGSLRRIGENGDASHCADFPVRNTPLAPGCTACFSGDAHRVAGTPAGDHQHVAVWINSGELLLTVTSHQRRVRYLSLDRSGRRVASAALDLVDGVVQNEIRVHDLSGGVLYSAGEIGRRTTSLALSPDGEWLAEAFVTGTPKSWSMPKVRLIKLDGTAGRVLEWPETAGTITALAWDPASQKLAASVNIGQVRVWRSGSGETVSTMEALTNLDALAFHPDGQRLAGANREQAQIWDTASGRSIFTFRGSPPRPNDNLFNARLAWSTDGTRLAVSQWNRTVSVWSSR